MTESRNLLIVKSSKRLTPEDQDRIEEYLKPLAAALNTEIIVLPEELSVEYHNNALLSRIDALVEVNQALLEYMINADDGSGEPALGSSLDG